MTHDELLAKLDGSTKSEWWLDLRTVIEFYINYPNPTIQAITKELE